MESRLPDQPLTDYTGQNRHVCPKCHGHLSRIPRRVIDHMLSFFVPIQRYRCATFACQWEGNVRLPKGAPNTTGK